MNRIITAEGFDIDCLNRRIENEPEALVAFYENRYDGFIAEAADFSLSQGSRIIFISGPSSSGKTTTSYKLAAELRKRGKTAHTVSTDDFFKPRSEAPLLKSGEQDLESIQAVDTGLLMRTLAGIINTGRAKLPRFNFIEGIRNDAITDMDIGDGGILIVEGIHALNPLLSSQLPQGACSRIYISVHSNFEKDNVKVLHKRKVRFLQRMVRDHRTRGISPENTFKMWTNVCRGEDQYIRPFARYADIRIDTTLPYSPAVLKEAAAPLLDSIAPGSAFFESAQQIKAALDIFLPLNGKYIPVTSVLREFLGGSVFET